MSIGATELYQWGLVLHLMKYYDRGRLVSQVEEIIRANVRDPDLVLGDLGAQIGATLMGVGRVKALAARYGTEVLADAFQQLLAAPQKRISQLVEKWPGHVAEAEALLDQSPVPAIAADKSVPVDGGWGAEPTIYFVQDQPLPMHVLSIMPENVTSER